MIQQPSVPTIINIAKICQYLASQANRSTNFYAAKPVDLRLPRLLWIERKALEFVYNNYPSDANLLKVANYVYSLCNPFSQQAQIIIGNQSAGLPIITNPANQSINVGQSATFTVAVTSSISYTIAWYRNGVLIPGQTGLSYTLANAQLTDSGAQFSAVATNANGTVSSQVATLTVTAVILGYAIASNVDYSTALLAGTDTVPYQFTFPITSGSPLSVQYPGPVAAEYIVIKYPATETTKVHYDNPPIDSGPIPGFALDHTTIGAWKYVFSRTGNPFTLNASNLLTLS